MWDRLLETLRRGRRGAERQREKTAHPVAAWRQDAANGWKSAGLISPLMQEAIAAWLDTFYGQTTPEERKRADTRFAAVLTSQAATLAVSELEVGAGEGALAAWVEREVRDGPLGDIHRAVQLAAAGGQSVLKPYMEDGRILCTCVAADRFIPLRYAGGRCVDAVFPDYAQEGGRRLVRLERHSLLPEGVLVENRAFWLNSAGIGASAPLETAARWRHLAPELMFGNVKHPLFACLRMPFANLADPDSPLPQALYAPAMDTLRELDRIYTAFLWEVQSGKRRQIVDVTAVKPHGGHGDADFAAEQYIVLDMGAGAQKLYDDYTPEMRIEAYQRALNVQLRLLESQCGFSVGTFSFDVRGGDAKTATQVLAEDRTTFNMIRAIQEQGMRQGLCDLVDIYAAYARLYRLGPAGGKEKLAPWVRFGDAVFEDTAVEFARRKALADAGLLRAEKLLSWYFGVSEETARNEYLPEGGGHERNIQQL